MQLGQALKRRRADARVTVRQVPGFSPGHVSNVERGYVTPSQAFVETYIRLFGGAAELRALYAQMKRLSERDRNEQRAARFAREATPSPPEGLTADITSLDISNHYVTEAHEAECSFTPSGSIEELRITVYIRALTSGVRLYYAGAYYEAERRPGVVEVEAIEGLTLLEKVESEAGAVKAFFRLGQILNPDDPAFRAVYRISVNSDRRAVPRLVYYASQGMLRMSLSANFSAGAYPRHLWHFSAPNIIGAQSETAALLEPVTQWRYSYDFQRPIPGWCYGFSWDW